MRQSVRILGGLAVAAGLVLAQSGAVLTGQSRALRFQSRQDAQSPPRNVPGIDKQVVVVTGEITGVENWTSNFYWVLRGAVFVRDGAILNIQPGTRVIGEAGTIGTLIVERGGMLNAIGTLEQPIVFTSDQAPGSRQKGDWGGLIINGRAVVNQGGGEVEGEADTGIYGGTNDADSSGSLKFVRVEFAGTEFSPDNELNGIAFQAVGNGGSYEYIQVHSNRDDGVEWFGGTATIKRVVLSNIADDSFDWTFGWRGKAQFVAIVKRGDDGDWTVEADSNEFNNNLEPRANPQIYNFTSCGDPSTASNRPDARRAVLFRRGTAVTFRNFVLFGSHKGTSGSNLGLQIDGSTTHAQVANGLTQIGAGVITQATLTPAANDVHADSRPYITSGRFPDVRLGVDPGLSAECFNVAAPNFVPAAGSLAGGLLPPIQPPADGFFEPVTFTGAVGPNSEDNWISGWTAFEQQ